LRQAGLVAARSDPTDGRKTLVSATSAGRKLISTIAPAREAWLEAAIEQNLTLAERRTLLKAADIMEVWPTAGPDVIGIGGAEHEGGFEKWVLTRIAVSRSPRPLNTTFTSRAVAAADRDTGRAMPPGQLRNLNCAS